jgi:rsbT co-antagonist protein RsbR
MSSNANEAIHSALQRRADELLEEWLHEQTATGTARSDLLGAAELRQQCAEFLTLFRDAVRAGSLTDIHRPEWAPVRELLADLSRRRALQGFTPSETAMFVLSLKPPLFRRDGSAGGQEEFQAHVRTLDALLDRLGLFTTEVYQRSRESVIQRQQQELLELSTPVVKLWEGIVAVPLIGTLDSERTQVVMENLLQRIVDIGATVAIIDITGVPTVDTLVAQHLIKTVAAARLMGAECIISGIRPQIAQTIVHLGVDLGPVTTKATLADAILLALKQTGFVVTRPQARS